MELQLSHRLQTVAKLVPAGARLLDVGSDHAYLPINLVQSGQIDYAIASEVVKGPFESAQTNVASNQLSDKIDVRLANGLAAFEPDDAISCITICGMGGRLIAEILDNGQSKLDSVERLILQANNREDDLRAWLAHHNYRIIAEDMVTENDKFYEIIVAEHGEMTLSAQDLRFGPMLNQTKSPVFLAKWKNELQKLSHAYSVIPENKVAERKVVEDKIVAIKEALHAS